MMLTVSVEAFAQRSAEWHDARVGKLTGSQAKRIIGSPAVRKTLTLELAAEMLTGKAYETGGGFASRRGIELEADGLAAFAFENGYDRDSLDPLPGLQVHPHFPRAACSPDGFIFDDQMVQIKCPLDPKNHMINAVSPDTGYVAQCQYELWCCDRETGYLVSYHPDFPPASQIITHEIDADPEMHDLFEKNVALICADADTYIEALT